MDSKQIAAFLATAQALLEVASKLGSALEVLITSLQGEPDEAEFGPCTKIGCTGSGPIVTYRRADGSLVRRVWCDVCRPKKD